MRSESLKSKRSRHRWNASLWLRGIVLPRTRIPIFLIFESFHCISRPINDMHTLIVKRISCLLNVVTSRPILFLHYRTVNYDWMVHLCIIGIRQNDSHKLFVSSDWIYFSLIVCILNSSHLGFCSIHHLFICLLIFLWFVMSFLHLIIYGHLHINWFFIFLRMILRLESFHLWTEATCHSHSLVFVYLFHIFGIVSTWTGTWGKNIELSLLKRRTIERRWVLVYLSLRLIILSRARNRFFILKGTLLLRFSKDKRHIYSP